MQARDLIVTSADCGLRLHVRDWSAGSDACLLLHGFGEGAHVWNRFAPSVARLFRTLAVDLRGHGESSWDPTGRYPVEGHVADALDVIETLRLRRLVVVGHSLGGDIALRIAAARPIEVIGLVVVEFTPDPIREGAARVRSDFSESIRTWDSVEEYASWLQERRPLVDFGIIQELAAAALRPVSDGGFRPKCDPAMGMSRSAEDQMDIWRLLNRISCPVLVVRGIGSAVFSDDSMRQMHKMLRNGSIRIVNYAGHAVMNDNPEGFADALTPFLRCMRMMSSVEGHG
jgi:pimeloyl-ACP methyl ester carboxylesterase